MKLTKWNQILKRSLSVLLALIMVLGMVPVNALPARAEETETADFAGKTISILGDSISTFSGVSNNTSYNSTIGSNAVYYSGGTLGVYRGDTWWQQIIDALGMELLVNNSWSGSTVFYPRKGESSVGYGDRCVNLHNDTTGEEPDMIIVFLGTNDFSYYQSTLGTADIDYDSLITADGYVMPTSTCEAYAIMLHKMIARYPDAEIYCLGMAARRNPDKEDSYADVGQPTAFNAELKAIVDRFGATYVDLENCGIDADAEVFDRYMGDGRVHPNAAGMDMITEAVVSALLGEQTQICTVSYSLNGVESNNTTAAAIEGLGYTASLTPLAGYSNMQITVTMGGVDVTETAYANGTVSIKTVTGDIVITAQAERAPLCFRWEYENGELVSEVNALTKLAGTTSNEVFTDTRYQLQITVLLKHNWAWVLEWKGSGAGGFMLSEASDAASAPFFFRRAGNYLNAFGDHDGSQYNNYGLALSTTDIDGSALHVYRLENHVAVDGTNMVYLYVDGVEIGALNNHYVGGNAQGTTSDWISGKDFKINYIGTTSHPLTNYALEYISITECNHTYENGVCTACGCTVSDSGYSHAIPENQGVQNAIDRAYALTDVEWTPLADVPGVQKIDGEYSVIMFEAGVTYRGIPYSGVTANDCYVGLNVSLESFLTALKNRNSVLYTENLFSTNPKSATYFGTVCSKFAQYVLDIPGSYNTNNVANIPGMETIAMPGEFTVDQIKLGDVVLNTATHTTVCTDILYDADGNVAYIEISEAVMPLVRRMLWSPEEFYEHFATYRLCRYQRIDEVPATDTVIVDDGYALMPRYGDKYNYRVSSIKGVVDVLESGYHKAVILRDGVIVQEIILSGATSFSFDRSVPGYLEMYLEKEDGSRSGSVYACVTQSSVSVNDCSEFVLGKLTVTIGGSCGVPLYVQVGSAHAIFCSVEEMDGTVDLTFPASKISTQQVRVAYQNEYGIYLSDWVPFTADTNPSNDPLLSQGQYWNGYNITPSSPTPVIQENKVGYWSYTMVPVEENTTYYSEGATRMWFLDENGNGISTYNAYKDGDVPFQFTTPDGTAYVSIAYSPNLVEQGTETLVHVHNYQSVVTAPTCTERGYTTYTCECGDSYVDDYVDATGHSYENGICTVCGAEDPGAATEFLSLRYDDHYDVTGKTVEIIDAGKPTSYQVGYGVEENAVPDTAVVILEGDTLVATGIGTAKVSIDGQLYEVTVEAAPISLLLLIGQSNMRGSEGNANQSIVCPDGMVYATYGDDRGADNTAMTVSNATHFAPSALTGEYSSINVEGTTDCLSGYPVYSLTEAGAGKIGPDSGFAYEWVRQTGEKVWIVNAAHGGTSINVWQPGTTEYEQCQALFTACQETLRKEIAAGHFTLSHMAYFWCQGCSDRTQSAQWYVNKYLAMHEGLKTEMAFDHDTNPDTADKTFEFGGIIPVRVGSTAACYRDGVYSVSNPYAYHESFVDLRFSGPRVAQYWMINNPELTDIWGVCDIGDDWVWMPDGTNGVSAYFQAHYPGGRVDYTTQVTQKESWYTPTTPAAVHDSVHYNQIGYNEYGREAVRNALIMLGEIAAPDVETTVELLSWDGYSPVEQVIASTAGNSGTLVVPRVYPIWKSKEVTYELSGGLSWEYYDLLAADAQTEGTLTAGGKTVHVAKAEPGVHYAEHLSELPEEICCGLNLWNVLEHDPYFYSTGTHWDIHSSGNVFSVTIPVNPGDRIFATAFGKAGENGHATSNGIRVTFFSEYGVARTLAPAECYAEFTANGGYLTAPEGTTAVNIAMWNNSADNELYLLDRGHDTDSGICGICGKDSHVHQWSDWAMKEIPGKGEPVTEERTCSGCGETETREVESVWQKYDLAEHYSDLPENVCAGLNLWNVLAHDKYYFASGTNWAVYSSGSVCSVTIPVNPGDRIFATAFGKAVENGHATANGIRVTFFSAYGIAKTMTPAECYAEFSANGGCLIAPEDAIAINVAMWNGSDENELYILNRDHIYENGTCTACGADHPNLANFEGKVISILGDSISTFAGYIPIADGFNLQHRPRYPQSNLFSDVNLTWWMQTITALDAKLGINDSWAGSTVTNTITGNSGDLGEKAAMASLTRIQNLGANGTPDVILFYGGTNDIGRLLPLGSFDPATAPTEVDLTTTKWTTVADAYVDAIMRLQYYYPEAEILAMLPTYTASYYTNAQLAQYNTVFSAICEHYGIPYIDLRDCGISTANLPDGIHPDATGMDYITRAVLDTLLNNMEMEAGEHIVHSVTHNLNGAESSLGYYKGITHGKSFVTTITGENVTVSVTMGGADITDTAYANGVVTIAAVTGDLVITAQGRVKPIYEDHLQQLPENLCCSTNLWSSLVPENTYYTGSAWGNVSGNSVYSITIPVAAGDQIWATSFQKSGTNGGSRNGIRLTWFDESGVLESVSPDNVYAEFSANGYLTAPEGVVAVNVVMWNGNESNEVYILNRDHVYENGSCTLCGEADPDYHIPGDITGDGEVDNKDLTRLFRYLSDYDVEVVEAALDVNGDGEVDNKDLTRLFRYLSNYDVEIH